VTGFKPFNFDNICIGNFEQNPISNFDDQIFRDGIEVVSTQSPDKIEVCFDIKSSCINPSLTIAYIPIDYKDPGNFIGIEYAGLTDVCAYNVTSGCPASIFDVSVNQCGPFTFWY